MRLLVALAVCASLTAGCGGRGAPATDAAELVPADATAYVTVAPGGLLRAHAALSAFGAAREAIPYLRQGRTARLRDGIVGFAQPADEKAFVEHLDRQGEVHAKIRGWVVYAHAESLLEAVKRSKRNLAETASYRRSARGQPQNALVRAYVPRGRHWRSATLSIEGGNARLEIRTPAQSRGGGEPTLAAEIPAGAVVAVAGAGSGVPPGAAPAVAAVSRVVGADVGSLVTSVGGPYVLYGIPGAPVPDVTFASRRRSSRALRELRNFTARLVGGRLPSGSGTVDLGPLTLHYGMLAGQLVLSDADDPVAELTAGPKLLEGASFRRAADAAALPAVLDGLYYVDAPRTLAAVRALSALAGRPVPPALERELAPLRALLDWTATSEGIRTVSYLRMS